MIYLLLGEMGYEIAQSNAAYILEEGTLLHSPPPHIQRDTVNLINDNYLINNAFVFHQNQCIFIIAMYLNV